jgi:hypothetical protein
METYEYSCVLTYHIDIYVLYHIDRPLVECVPSIHESLLL